MVTVATHDGNFHADEVFAVAILKLVYPKIKVIRTREPDIYSKADIIVDIGKKYSPKKKLFDHHQNNLKGRKNGIPYASAGLVWKHYWNKIANSKKVFEIIDRKIMQPIDALDCGVSLFDSKKDIFPYDITSIISSFRPSWKEGDKNFDKNFHKAVWFSMKLLRREIKITTDKIEATKLVRKVIKKNKDKEYLILPKKMPWEESINSNSKIKFVIYQSSGGEWTARAVPKRGIGFNYDKKFPKKWAGLSKEKLSEITGVKDAIFCHKAGFAVFADSKEGIIKLTEKALRNK
ncbi:MAG: MYG1 family protein [Candidatus Pacearchaeota archaeon]